MTEMTHGDTTTTASGSAANPQTSVLTRGVLQLANSRESMLFVLIVLLAGTMAIVYPNNFATRYNISAVLLNAAQNGILVAGMMLLMIAGSSICRSARRWRCRASGPVSRSVGGICRLSSAS